MENNLRQEILQKVLNVKCNNIVLELATGVGKTKLALEKLHQLYNYNPSIKVLIVIPRNVLIQNWKDEFVKWGYTIMLPNVTFTTYVSLPKHAGKWNVCIFDEAHHLSERCQEVLMSFNIFHTIFLSATLKKQHIYFIKSWRHYKVAFFKVNTKDAIDNGTLPDPKIILIPLDLDTEKQDIIFEKRKGKHNEVPLVIPYEKRWDYRSYKGALSFKCTQRQYYHELSGLIEWYKKKNYNPAMRNIWLHKCGIRLQWLSTCKLPYTMQIMQKVHSRYIVFCNTIAESNALKIPAVNSAIGFDNLGKFNDKVIDKLAAVNCLNEGINCAECQVGIFNAINSSDIMQTQKGGRLLRHQSPIFIIPYFRDTREEEIVKKWVKGFNKEMIIYKTIDKL